ncbi:MAG: SWIM zinc finger domain-containing protein [Anaerolineae bacterium]|nr:SWIM zinc finger domain-containing protein [Anaerolineae bacterium]NUQ02903.1 SWIM zinc finger family protein [Anaerolineae bacterium]
MKPTDIKRLQKRSRVMRVTRVTPTTLVVYSRSNPQLQHIVTIEWDRRAGIRARCTCPWAQHGGAACSHVLAALNFLAAEKHRTISFWLNVDDARRQKHRVLTLRAGDGDVFITSRPADEEKAS